GGSGGRAILGRRINALAAHQAHAASRRAAAARPAYRRRSRAIGASVFRRSIMHILSQLEPLRTAGGRLRTPGLSEEALRPFQDDPGLKAAVADAVEAFARIRGEYPELVGMDEEAQLRHLQAGFVNFYPDDAVNPYVAIAAR